VRRGEGYFKSCWEEAAEKKGVFFIKGVGVKGFRK